MNTPPDPIGSIPPPPPKDGGKDDINSPAPHAKPTGSTPRQNLGRIRNRAGRAPVAGELPWYIRHDEVHTAMGLEPDLRRKELLFFLWRTGARISEALLFRGEDIDRNLGLAQVFTRKRKTLMKRPIPLPRHYLDRLTAIAPADGGPIWPWSRTHAYLVIRAALERAGVEPGRAHPHSLRHGHAMHAIGNHVSLEAIQKQLGHAYISSTGQYLRATAEDVRREYEKISWVMANEEKAAQFDHAMAMSRLNARLAPSRERDIARNAKLNETAMRRRERAAERRAARKAGG